MALTKHFCRLQNKLVAFPWRGARRSNNPLARKIKQTNLVNGYILNQKELVKRAKDVFECTGLKTKIIPVVYSLNVDHITPSWINHKMLDFGR